jgi:hypothetical protein
MDREDARKLSPDAQHERRRQVVRAYKRGVNRRQIAREFGLSYSSVRMIVNRYKQGGARQKLSMISTVTNQGKTSWMIVDGNFNHVRLIEFFEALIRQAGRKVFLVLDNLGVHHCAPVKEWLAAHVKQIEVFYLPSYSPELNPDERLNGDLKQAIGTRVPGRTKDKLYQAASNHMTAIENYPDRIKAFFRDPFVAYAA